ncbi:MAG: phosphatase PAP2 family protein [Chloroflexi bacterium]|nr:phosphatase PAP2 family protein [Chloroflexota bacterium]
MSIAEPPVSERTAVCDSGVTVSATLAGRLLLGLQVVALLLMAGTVATKVWQDHIWAGFALVGITLVVWAPEVRFRRERVWWFAYVAGIFVYTLLRAYADETGIPVRTQYVISIDQAVFLGTDPIVWLQQRFFDPVSLGLHDYLSVVVHWSFFIAPHLGAVLVFLYRRTLFPKYVVMIAGTMYLALVLFFLLPTAPPWLAGQTGALPGAYRVMDFVGGSVDPDTYQSFYASLGEPNSGCGDAVAAPGRDVCDVPVGTGPCAAGAMAARVFPRHGRRADVPGRALPGTWRGMDAPRCCGWLPGGGFRRLLSRPARPPSGTCWCRQCGTRSRLTA